MNMIACTPPFESAIQFIQKFWYWVWSQECQIELQAAGIFAGLVTFSSQIVLVWEMFNFSIVAIGSSTHSISQMDVQLLLLQTPGRSFDSTISLISFLPVICCIGFSIIILLLEAGKKQACIPVTFPGNSDTSYTSSGITPVVKYKCKDLRVNLKETMCTWTHKSKSNFFLEITLHETFCLISNTSFPWADLRYHKLLFLSCFMFEN